MSREKDFAELVVLAHGAAQRAGSGSQTITRSCSNSSISSSDNNNERGRYRQSDHVLTRIHQGDRGRSTDHKDREREKDVAHQDSRTVAPKRAIMPSTTGPDTFALTGTSVNVRRWAQEIRKPHGSWT